MDERRSLNLLLEEHIAQEGIQYSELKQDIQELKEAVQALTATWNQAKGVLSFIKWILGISGGITAFLVFVKDHIK